VPVKIEPAGIARLGQQIPDRGPQRAGQDERRPEEQCARRAREEIGAGDEGQCAGEDERPAFIAEP